MLLQANHGLASIDIAWVGEGAVEMRADFDCKDEESRRAISKQFRDFKGMTYSSAYLVRVADSVFAGTGPWASLTWNVV